MTTRLLVFASAVVVLGACGAQGPRPSLLSPVPDPRAPDSFDVTFETNKGRFTVTAIRDWSPLGVDRFHHLVTSGYFDRTKFFRVLSNYVVQWGFHGDSAVNAAWSRRTIADEPVRRPNAEGTVSFAKGGPDSRATNLFINLRDNRDRLDTLGFVPIGRVTSGMHVVRSLYAGYGDGPPRGGGPAQNRIAREGNLYLERNYPRLDSILRARLSR